MANDEKTVQQKKADLLSKFGKSTKLFITQIEDDSSGDGEDGTQVKILHLNEAVTAVGSNPAPSGETMKVKSAQVYVAADDIDKFFEDVEEKDGLLAYSGTMHLDVSKPRIREVNGVPTVTKPAKVWLTSVKFSRRGSQLRASQQTSLSSMINKMFTAGSVYDLTAPNTGNAPEVQQPKNEKVEATVVPNQQKQKVN